MIIKVNKKWIKKKKTKNIENNENLHFDLFFPPNVYSHVGCSLRSFWISSSQSIGESGGSCLEWTRPHRSITKLVKFQWIIWLCPAGLALNKNCKKIEQKNSKKNLKKNEFKKYAKKFLKKIEKNWKKNAKKSKKNSNKILKKTNSKKCKQKIEKNSNKKNHKKFERKTNSKNGKKFKKKHWTKLKINKSCIFSWKFWKFILKIFKISGIFLKSPYLDVIFRKF